MSNRNRAQLVQRRQDFGHLRSVRSIKNEFFLFLPKAFPRYFKIKARKFLSLNDNRKNFVPKFCRYVYKRNFECYVISIFINH